ncbi:MAG: ferritin family protein [Candidatus Omnitrophota bacterium]|jgi:rubrerythrin
MNVIFSGSEIAEMAIQIEKNGFDFYKAVAARSKTKAAKNIFNYLAGQEKKHMEVFRKMVSAVKKYELPGAYTDDYFGYIKALSEGYIFTKKKKGKAMAETVRDGKRAVELGLSFERDSILFYYEMKNFVPEAERGIIEGLIKEEQRHVVKLSLLRRRCYA